MELHNAREIKGSSATSNNTNWILWVDDEIWGYVSTLNDAQWFLSKVSTEITKELVKKHPQWTIECIKAEDNVKILCMQAGYIYNSKWTAHTVRYEPTCKLIRENDAPICKRAPSFETIQYLENEVKPYKKRKRRRRTNKCYA